MAYKLIIAIFTVLLLTASSAFSQSSFTFGFKGGISNSTPIVNYTYPQSGNVQRNALYGFARGITFHYRFFKGHVSFQPEVLWVKKGMEEITTSEEDGITTTKTETLTFDYIEIPYLLKGNFTIATNTSVNIFGGVYQAGMVNGTSRVQTQETDKTNNRLDITGYDIGMTFGSGVDYRIKRFGTLTLDARVEIGFIDLYKDRDRSLPVYKNRTYLLMVGYEF